MSENKIPYKIYLDESEIPDKWYNLRADMKNKPAPLLNPGTGKPMTAEELSTVFCEELVSQELDNDTAYIEIPQEIRNVTLSLTVFPPFVSSSSLLRRFF